MTVVAIQAVKKKYLTPRRVYSKIPKVSKMDRIIEKGFLYDFYRELLTEHQRQIYEDAVYNDMSLSEIAQEHGISRQGVHDLLRRCDKILADYEEKLSLVAKFDNIKEKVEQINSISKDGSVRKLAAEILEEL